MRVLAQSTDIPEDLEQYFQRFKEKREPKPRPEPEEPEEAEEEEAEEGEEGEPSEGEGEEGEPGEGEEGEPSEGEGEEGEPGEGEGEEGEPGEGEGEEGEPGEGEGEEGEPGEGEGEEGEPGEGEEGEPGEGEGEEGEPGEGEEGEPSEGEPPEGAKTKWGEGGKPGDIQDLDPDAVPDDEIDDAIDQLDDEIDRLENQMEGASEKKQEQLQNQIDNLNDKKDDLQERKDELEDDTQSLDDALDDMENRKKEIDDMNDLLSQTSDPAKRKELQEKIKQKQEELDELKDNVSDTLREEMERQKKLLDEMSDKPLDELGKQMEKDINTLSNKIAASESETVTKVKTQKPPYKPPPKLVAVERKLERHIGTLLSDFKQRWEAAKRGKLSIKQIIKAKAAAQNTKIWKLDKIYKHRSRDVLKEVRLGVVICVDRSYSMIGFKNILKGAGGVTSMTAADRQSYQQYERGDEKEKAQWRGTIEPAMQACWAITKALQNTNSKVMIMAYSSNFKGNCRIEKTFEEKEGVWDMDTADGGTPLQPVLRVAQSELLRIKRKDNIKNLIIVVISDGDITDEQASRPYMAEIMNRGEINLFLIGITKGAIWKRKDGEPWRAHEIANEVEIDDLPKVMERYTRKMQKRVLENVMKTMG